MNDNNDEIDREKYFSLFEKFKNENRSPVESNINSRILLVDHLNCFIRAFCASPSMNDDGEHIGGVSGYLYSIGNAIRLTKCTRCIIISDGSGGSQRRRKIYPEYKMGRKVQSRIFNRHYDWKSDQEEKEAMSSQLIKLMKYLENLPVQFISVESVEADDIISYLSQEVFDKPENKITIMSSDKDFLQLVNDRISVWSPTKKRLYTPNAIVEEYGISPKNFLFYRMLDGDKSDNIDGIKGAGLKTIAKYLPMVSENISYTINEVIDFCKNKNSGKKKIKFYSNIYEQKDVLERNYQLMQLEYPSISASTKLKITELISKKVPILNKYQIHMLYIHDKISSAIPNINEWLLNTFSILNSFATNQK